MPIWQVILLAIALLLGVISIFLLVWNSLRAKKMREASLMPAKPKLTKIKFPFKVDKFIDILGGIENIKTTSATNNKIKISVVERDKVDFSELKKIKNRGILDQSDAISIVLGSYVGELSKVINDLINLHQEQK